jgi:anti-anti-sigma factor
VQVVADFKKLRYVNSTGLGILLHFSKAAREKGGCFKIANVNENVYEIIEIIGAMSLLEIYDEVEDALAALS